MSDSGGHDTLVAPAVPLDSVELLGHRRQGLGLRSGVVAVALLACGGCWLHQGDPVVRSAGADRVLAKQFYAQGDLIAAEQLLQRASRRHPGSIDAVQATLERFVLGEEALHAAATGSLGAARSRPLPVDGCPHDETEQP